MRSSAFCFALLTACLLFPAAAEETPSGQQVRALLAEDSWREALELARQWHSSKPGDPHSAAQLGRALFRAGKFEEVERLLAPLAEDPESPAWALLTLARLRHAQGRGRDASALAVRAVASAPDDRLLIYHAADVAPTRQRTVEWLQSYLELSEGDDADRIEDARGTLRVLRELGDREVWIPLEQPERLDLPLRHLWDEGGETVGYVLTASVGEKGKSAKLLLDTGNHGLYVIQRIAKKRGFTSLGEATTYGGAGEARHRVRRGVFPAFAVGGLRYAEALVTSTPEEVEATGRFQGLLGLTPFSGYRVTMDFKKKRLLLDSGTEPQEGEPYWIVSGQILVRARASGGEPGLFLLDTGAMRSLLNLDYARGLAGARLRDAANLQGLGGRYEGAQSVENVRMEFQGLSGQGPLIAVDTSTRSRMTGVEIAGYLGLELLDKSRIVIDTRNRTIRVEQ